MATAEQTAAEDSPAEPKTAEEEAEDAFDASFVFETHQIHSQRSRRVGLSMRLSQCLRGGFICFFAQIQFTVRTPKSNDHEFGRVLLSDYSGDLPDDKAMEWESPAFDSGRRRVSYQVLTCTT